jgi:peptidoglycan hydrolase CwlO-like protein
MNRLAAIAFLEVLSLVVPQVRGKEVTASPNSTGQCPPPAVVASFLGFTEGQAAQFGELLSQFQTTVRPLQEQIATRQAQLDSLLNKSQPNPAEIGRLILEIHALQQQVAQAIESYQSGFAGLLTGEQREKVQQVAGASQLQPVVGAFVALHLVPPPSPLPCQKE